MARSNQDRLTKGRNTRSSNNGSYRRGGSTRRMPHGGYHGPGQMQTSSTVSRQRTAVRNRVAPVRPVRPNNNIRPVPGHNMVSPTQDVLTYTVPFRNGIMTNTTQMHLGIIRNMLSARISDRNVINQTMDELSFRFDDFIRWMMERINSTPTPMNMSSAMQIDKIMTGENYNNDTGGTRACNGCSGLFGSCGGTCIDLSGDIDPGSGGWENNWNNPGQWKIKEAKITVYIAIPF
tara:strand:+ start:630 stop:1331 length:702 start_codon:yes stop_codon:yes gene_type:complete